MTKTPPKIPLRAAVIMVGVFVSLAVLFKVNLIGDAPPLDVIPTSEAAFASTSTVRAVRATMTFEGTPCSECHQGTEPMQGNPSEHGTFHEKIKLKHGRNKLCFNCHNRLQPANFSDYDGSPIKLERVELLCAKCHGTTFRDWNSGVHGRRSGYWDEKKGPRPRTVCIACHDPHWPVFKAIKSAAAPHVNPRTRAEKGAHAEEAGGEHE